MGTGVALKEMVFPLYPTITREMTDAIERESPDLLLHHQIMLGAAWGAELAGLTTGCVVLAPTSWPSEQNPCRYPTMPDRDRYRPWLVRLGMASAHRIADWMFDPPLNRQRRALGLPKQRHIVTRASLHTALNLGPLSRATRDRAGDDPNNAHVLGFPFLDTPEDAWGRTDEGIKAFLDAGEPPVLVTLGSTVSPRPGDTHQRFADACVASGRRAIVLAPEVSEPTQTDDVLVVPPDPERTPHAGIMPRWAARSCSAGSARPPKDCAPGAR